jgi:hypothetical protein
MLPLQNLTIALMTALGLPGIGLTESRAMICNNKGQDVEFKTTLHEDNKGCRKLAKLKLGQIMPRSKQ